MSNKKILGIIVGLAMLALLFRKKKAPVATVDLGVPVVTGSGSSQFGGTDYGVVTPTD